MFWQHKNTFLESVTVYFCDLHTGAAGHYSCHLWGRFGPSRGIYCVAQLSVEVKATE